MFRMAKSVKKMNEKKGMAFMCASLGPLVVKQLALDSSVTAALGAEVAEIVRTLNPPLPSGEREGVRGIPSSQPSPLEVRGEGERAVMTAVLDKIYPVQSNKPRNPQIAGWLIKQVLEHKHNDKLIMAEDFYKIGEDFTYFESLKKSDVGIKTDLLRYSNLTELRQTLEPFQQKKQKKESEELERHLPKEQRDKLMAETTVLYSGPEGKVVIPHTPESSIYWGNNTKWCISGKDYAKTHFPSYNEQSPVIMILPTGKENDKVALVDRILYDSADDQIPTLPSEHQALMNKTLKKLSLSARSGLEAWLPPISKIEPETVPPNPVPVQPRVIPEDWEKEIHQTLSTGRTFQPELWANKDFVLEAVRQDGWMLGYATSELQADPAIVMDAVRQDGWALQYAARELKADPAIVTEAVRQDGEMLYCAARELKSDPVIVLEAVRQNGRALEYAAPALQEDRAFILEAVRQDGGALRYAAPKLRADPAIVMEAVRQDGGALCYAARELKADSKIIMDAVRQYGRALKYAAPALKTDPAIVMEAVRQDGWALQYAAREFKADPTIVMEAVRQYGGALEYAAPELKADPAFTLCCLEDEDLVFKIRSLEKYGLRQPDNKTVEQYQIKALERMAAKSDSAKFGKYARHFKAVWGDAELLFGGDLRKALEKMKADFAGRYAKTPVQPRFAVGH